MKVDVWPSNVDMPRCQGQIAVAADMINREMIAHGFQSGTINAGGKAVRLDSVGADSVSVYIFCSEHGLYVLTAHSEDDSNGQLMDTLWQAMDKQF
jgi:hypothetical protein